MAVEMACIVGEGIHRGWQSADLACEHLGPRETPFGASGEICLVTGEQRPFYVLARYGDGLTKTAPFRVNSRANLYALKDLGVQRVLGWGACGAIRHSMAVGDVVLLHDLIDQTHLRKKTFFEDSPLGYLRQFPVFCPALRRAAAEVLDEMRLPHQESGIVAVREGPRLETPAEITMLANLGAVVVTHTLVPEMFLARELELCYAGLCYVVNYAETGSRHHPFLSGGLFGGLAGSAEAERVGKTIAAAPKITAAVARAVDEGDFPCECERTMAHNINAYGLDADWRKWFA